MKHNARLINSSDVGLTAGLLTLAALSWVLPQNWHPAFARRNAFAASLALGVRASTIERVRLRTGDTTEAARRMLNTLAVEDLMATMHLLRSYRPGASHGPTTLQGQAHLDEALAQGRGAILWTAHFVHHALAAKVALHRAGYRVHHLSHPRHGFSASRFGMRWLNRVRTAAENRYLAERVMLDLQSATSALQRLRGCLKDNQVVSMGARTTSTRPVPVELLDGHMKIAPGAAVMALKTGAALLPAAPVREANGVVLYIGAPLRGASAQALADDFARWCEPLIARHPEQWLGWMHLD